MTTKKQLDANRRNAKLSTGPTTAAGQARSSKNALKHGLTANEVTLEHEDAKKFAAFRDDIIQKLAPVGALEEELAQHAVLLFWRRRRVAWLEVTETRCFSDGECGVNPPVYEFMSDGFRNLMRYESSLDRTLQRTLRELERLQTRRREEADMHLSIAAEINGIPVTIRAPEMAFTPEELGRATAKLKEELEREKAASSGR
jgi:hypothetical protein